LVWDNSNRYIRLKNEYRETCRKQAAVVEYKHSCMAKVMADLGTEFYVEEMRFNALQARSKKVIKIKKGRRKGQYKSNKRYGGSLLQKAPAEFIARVKRTVEIRGKTFQEINTVKARASQFDHLLLTYIRAPVNIRVKYIGGVFKIQRDLYSAFLIMCIIITLDGFDIAMCKKMFVRFIILHDREIQRLKEKGSNLSSMGIDEF
jgi:hypothetical protein